MKFNSAVCIKSGCLARDVPCVEFAIGSKAKNRIGTDKLIAVNSNINIKLVNAKHFFRMARQKGHKSYIQVPRVLSTDCTNKECRSFSNIAKWCVNTTSRVAPEDYSRFMKNKPEYTKEDLLKRVPLEYHSIINVFMKSNANIVVEYRANWDYKIHLEESKKVLFVRNYKPLSD